MKRSTNSCKLSIEEKKIEMLEQESTIKMEKLKAETEWKRLNVEKKHMKVKLDIIHQRFQHFNLIATLVYSSI